MIERSDTSRTFLVTGANTGIGRAIAEGLARAGGRVWLACRSEERARPALESLRSIGGERSVAVLPVDLGDLASVRRAAAQFLATDETLDVLVNNAGVAGARGLSADGFEIAFGVNHLGHHLFTSLLLERLRARPHARIVTVASDSHFQAKGIDYAAVRATTETVTGLREYEVSKLCNLLFTAELARRSEGTNVRTYAVDPGRVASDVWRRVPWPVRSLMKLTMVSTEQGARSALHCALSPEVAAHSGRYYAPDGREKAPSKLAQDSALAAELWAKSDEWVASR